MAIRFQYSIVCLFGVFGLLENVHGKSACLKMRVTSKGFNRVWENAHVMDQLKRTIQVYTELSHQHGEVNDFLYALTGLMVTDFTKPHSNIVTVPGMGLRLNADGASISMTALFDFSNKWIPYIEGVGSLDILITGLDFSLNLNIGMDPLGRPTFAASDYSCTISEVNFTFHGGWTVFFSRFLEDEVRRTLRNNICKGVMKTINRIVEKKLSFPVTYHLGPDFELDYGLQQAPTFQSFYMETFHKCEISWHGIKVVFPFEPPTMADTGDTQKMTYLWISDHVFSTWLYAAHVHNYLTTYISPEDVQIMFRRIGVPDLLFSDRIMDFSMVSNNNPTMTITPDDVKVHFGLKVVHKGRQRKNNLAYSVSVIFNVKISFTISVTDALYWKINYVNIKVDEMNSSFGSNDTERLQTLINDILKLRIPLMNEIGQKGFPFSLREAFPFLRTSEFISAEPSIRFMQHAILMEDVLYGATAGDILNPRWLFISQEIYDAVAQNMRNHPFALKRRTDVK